MVCSSCTMVSLWVVAWAALAPANADWVNMTVYHTNQANWSAGDLTNMNSADDLGDIEFTVRAKIIPVECVTPGVAPWDCANPEQDASNLAVTKLIIQVNTTAIGAYCPCNVHEGVYSCSSRNGSLCGGFGAISVKDFLGHAYNPARFNASTPTYDWFAYNTLMRFGVGMWYSTPSWSQCADDKLATPTGGPCAWRVAEVVKRVARNCSDAVQEAAVAAASGGCFDGCAQPTNRSSACWIDCYFRTMLGNNSAHGIAAPTDGLPVAKVRALWEAPFESDDPSKGGCPPI